MKAALVLFGIAYKSEYIGPHTGGRVRIDFRNSVQNYREYIIYPFFRSVIIDPSTVNIVTRLMDGLICDNLYIFPFHKIQAMRQFISHTNKQSHYWETDLIRVFGRIHFLTVDPTWVGGIHFYNIIRNRIPA